MKYLIYLAITIWFIVLLWIMPFLVVQHKDAQNALYEAYRLEAVSTTTLILEAPKKPIWTTRERITQLITLTFREDVRQALEIVECESNLDPLAYNPHNQNGSVDRGLFQINSVHDERLAELGLDPLNIEDNVAYARMLYDEQGWTPWVCFTA